MHDDRSRRATTLAPGCQKTRPFNVFMMVGLQPKRLEWSEISCVHLPPRCLCVFLVMGAAGLRISWSPKMHLRLTTFEFGICLWPVFTSHLPPCCYISQHASVPHFCFRSLFLLVVVVVIGHVFMSSKTSPARPFVELRITFHYSSWVNIKFNMMHQINVRSVFAFRRALKTTWRWFLLCFSFSAVFVVFMFSKADPDGVVGEVHELISMLLDSRQPQFFQRKIEIIISQTLRQKEKPSSERVWKVFSLRRSASTSLLKMEKGTRLLCVMKCLEKLDRNFFRVNT